MLNENKEPLMEEKKIKINERLEIYFKETLAIYKGIKVNQSLDRVIEDSDSTEFSLEINLKSWISSYHWGKHAWPESVCKFQLYFYCFFVI